MDRVKLIFPAKPIREVQLQPVQSFLALLHPMADELETQELERLRAEVARLREELEERSEEVELLHHVLRVAGTAVTLQDLLDAISKLAVETTETDFAALYLLDREKNELLLSAASNRLEGVAQTVRVRTGDAISSQIAREGIALVMPKAIYEDQRFKYLAQFNSDTFHSYLSVPMISKDEVVGVISVRMHAPYRYSDKQVHLLSTIARQGTAVIEGAQAHEAVRRRASEISAISEVSKTITSNLYLEEILQLIVGVTAQSLNFKASSIMLLESDGQELGIKASTSESREFLRNPKIKVTECIAGRAVLEGQPVTVLDVNNTPGYRYPDIAGTEKLGSLISVPLTIKDEIIGVLNCYTEQPRSFSEEEQRLLMSVANQAAIAIVNAKLMVKSAIIQEMHHRVKNNLQTIASLLRLEMHHHADESVAEVLKESINRILSIAAVHDILSREDLDLISVNQVAEQILEHARQSLVQPGMQIDMSVGGPEILLSSSKATSMALILNELVHNALEHGLAGHSMGILTITFARQTGRLQVHVANDGNPLPDNFDEIASQRLGLQIVKNLVGGELAGRFTIKSDGAITRAIVDFPEISM